MSQSDYLKHKRNAAILKEQSNYLLPVIRSMEYVQYKEFTLANTLQNTKSTFNRLSLPNVTSKYGVDVQNTTCPVFTLCVDTHARPNRRPLNEQQSSCFPIMKAPGRSVPTYYNGSTYKKPESMDVCKSALCRVRPHNNNQAQKDCLCA